MTKRWRDLRTQGKLGADDLRRIDAEVADEVEEMSVTRKYSRNHCVGMTTKDEHASRKLARRRAAEHAACLCLTGFYWRLLGGLG